MNITVFSKRTGIGTDSLPHYDRLGLLCPVRQSNGYRVYTETLLETGLQIRALRDLDVPLEQIALLLKGDLSSAALLEEHESRLLGRFMVQRKALTELRALLRGKRRQAVLEVQTKVFPAMPVLSIRAMVAWDAVPAFRAACQREFGTYLQAQQVLAAGQVIVLQHNLDFIVDYLDLEVLLPISKAMCGSGRIRAGEMPALKVMLTRHSHSVQTALPLYQQLHAHLENLGFRTGTAIWLEDNLLGYEILEAI